MAAILFFNISQNIFKSKYYTMIVYCKPLKLILSEIDTRQKTCMWVTVTAPTSHSRATKIGQILNTDEAILNI